MRATNIFGIVFILGVLAMCTARSGQTGDPGAAAPESVSQESVVSVSPKDMADLDYYEEMEQVR